MRSLLVFAAVLASMVAPAVARGQSFAQPSGEAGCLLQTGISFNDEDSGYLEYEPKDCGRASGLMNARAVVVSPDQRNVYVTSGGGAVTGANGVVTLARGEDGTLTPRGCVTATGGDGRVGSDGLCTHADSLRGANQLALSPDGRFAYVAATGSNGVSWFERDPATGALTAKGCVKHTFGFGERCLAGYALDGAAGIAVSPDGKHVYVASPRSGAVTVFARDDTTGALTESGCVSDTGSDGQCADGTALAGADGVLVSGDGADVYVTSAQSGSVTGFRRDATTGVLTPHGCLLADAPQGGPCTSVPALASVSGGAISADGRNLYVATDTGRLVTLARDTATGTLTGAGCLQYVPPTKDESVDPDDYYEDDETELLPGCSAARALDGASAVTVAADGRAVYVGGGYSLSAFGRDPATGALTQFGCIESDPTYKACAPGRAIEGANGVAASADGRSLYVTSSLSSSVSVFTASVAIVSRAARVSRARAIRVSLACPKTGGRACVGDVRALGAASTRYRMSAGARRTVRVRVPRRARRAAVIVARSPHTGDVRRAGRPALNRAKLARHNWDGHGFPSHSTGHALNRWRPTRSS